MPKVKCPWCGKLAALKGDGTLVAHGYRGGGYDLHGYCDGTGQNPDRYVRPEDQQLPEVNQQEPVQDQVCRYIEHRKQIGIQRYGTPLQAHNGRDALRDAFEEAVDLVQYLAQMLIERDGKLPGEQV